MPTRLPIECGGHFPSPAPSLRGRGQSCPALLSAIAAWACHIRGDNAGKWGPVDDPLAGHLADLWATRGTGGIIGALFGAGRLFAATWRASTADALALQAALAAS